MGSRGHNWGLDFQTLLVSALLGVGGCAIQHRDRFAENAGDPFSEFPPLARPASPLSDQVASLERKPSPSDSTQRAEWRYLSPHVAAASYQVSEKESTSESQNKNINKLPTQEKADPAGAAKDAASKARTTSGRLSFDQVISATLLADNKIRAGLEAINQANADLRTSSLLPNPTLVTDGVLLPLRRFTPDQTGGPPQMDVLVGYPIDWFLFGKRVSAMASASLGVSKSEADYADLIRLRVRDAAIAFYDVVEAKALIDLARQDTNNLSQLEAANKKAVDDGGKPMVDLNRVRLDLLKSQQAQREAEAALVDAKARLRAFLGRTDPDPSFDLEFNLDSPITTEPLPVEEAMALAQENRPDVQSLRRQVAKAQADTVVERRKAYPQITPQFGYTRQFQTEAIGQPDADSWDVSITTTLPLFDRNQGNRAKAESVAVQSNFNLQAGLVDLRAEIVQIVEDFRTAYQNARSIARDQLRLAAEIRDNITKAYNAGGRPLIDVLDAQRNYRETYRLYITSRTNYWRSLYKFDAAIGKQIQPHDEQPR
jgi:cobalt-zinc-cadmium efflux system outer membrane protein